MVVQNVIVQCLPCCCYLFAEFAFIFECSWKLYALHVIVQIVFSTPSLYFPSSTVHYIWNVFQQEVSIFPNNDQISKDKKLRSHFPLSVVHTDMLVQGLL